MMIFIVVDKTLLLRLFQKPPRYTSKIILQAIEVIPYLVMFHLLVSIAMIGRIFEGVEPTSNGVEVDVENQNADTGGMLFFYHWAFILLILILQVLRFVGFRVMQSIFKCIAFLTCIHHSEVKGGISRTVQQCEKMGWIQDLPSYAIEENPLYRDAITMQGRSTLTSPRQKMADVENQDD